jgi:hypothetical protein
MKILQSNEHTCNLIDPTFDQNLKIKIKEEKKKKKNENNKKNCTN